MATNPVPKQPFNWRQSFRENKVLYIGAAIALIIFVAVLLS